MIPQYSWRCGGMRVRAPTDAASEKARDQGEAKRQYAAQQMDLPSQRRSRSRLAGSPKPPMESRQAHSIHGVALSRASSRPRCATGSIPTPRPGHPAHGTKHEADPGAQKQKYAQNCNFFAKRIVVTEQFLRKTRVPSMPIRPSSSTEPQRIDHTSTHSLTLGKDPALARLKNATSEEKRWAK